MADKSFVKIEGLKEVEKALVEIGKSAAGAVLTRVLVKRAKPIVEDAKRLAPKLSGDLEKSITIGKASSERRALGKAAFGRALQGGASRAEATRAMRDVQRGPVAGQQGTFAEIIVGPGRNPQAIQQEFGNVNHGPQPYLRPSWDQNKAGVIDGIGEDLMTEINKTAARQRARAAKKAAAQG